MIKLKHKTKKSTRFMRKIPIAGTSGATLLFVLAVMFILLAIGVSVLVASGAGASAMLRQIEHNRIKLLDEAVHNNIRHSLQSDDPDTLGNMLIWEIYEKVSEGNRIGKLTLNTDGIILQELDDLDGDVRLSGITIEFMEQKVVTNGPFAAVFITNIDIDPDSGDVTIGYDLAEERVPKTATVLSRILVTVEITQNGGSGDDVIYSSSAEYVYNGVIDGLTDVSGHPVCTDACLNDPEECFGPFDDDMAFAPGGSGQWELVSRNEMINIVAT
ncbi:MAG: hypothetical protein FWH17_06810 [Oscillospiraceae bacterium]|nr:hypothetical protein [Oscillospiraceae bacterium]